MISVNLYAGIVIYSNSLAGAMMSRHSLTTSGPLAETLLRRARLKGVFHVALSDALK